MKYDYLILYWFSHKRL